MFNHQFERFQILKEELQFMCTLCPKQYFTTTKCKYNCGRKHVTRDMYPCIYYFAGHCKHGYKCQFRHIIKRKVAKPQPAADICRAYYDYGFCHNGNSCKYSHNLRGEPCIWNSLGSCKYSAIQCRFSHDLKVNIKSPCYYHLLAGCDNNKCTRVHAADNISNVTYQGRLSSD